MVSHPLKVTTTAHYGWSDWLAQRITAIVMTIYVLLVLGIVLWNGGVDYALWKRLFAHGAFRLTSFVFMIAVLYHTWIGVRNITMDYLKSTATRLVVQIVVICVLIAYAGWTIQILWG